MLTPANRLIPDPNVAGKVIDGEAILIDVATGAYHSLDGAGALVWELIESGCALEQIARAVAERYETSAGQARADVERLAGELLAGGLVTVAEDHGRPPVPAPAPALAAKLAYVAPRLTTYTDMVDLLALDPPMPQLGPAAWDAAASE